MFEIKRECILSISGTILKVVFFFFVRESMDTENPWI